MPGHMKRAMNYLMHIVHVTLSFVMFYSRDNDVKKVLAQNIMRPCYIIIALAGEKETLSI